MPDPLTATTQFSVPNKLAVHCLKSAPFKRTLALQLVQALQPLLEFHSTIDYLKDPQSIQPNYPYPGIDLLQELGQIESKVNSSQYCSEVDFQAEVHDLFNRGHDAHLGYNPPLSGVFQVARPGLLVSLSIDGTSPPRIFFFYDRDDLTNALAGTYEPSPVVGINEQDMVEYLKVDAPAFASRNQDADATYQNEFFGWTSSLEGGGAFYKNPIGFLYESETNITFANGTHFNRENQATLVQSFDGIVDGDSFYDAFAIWPSRFEDRLRPIAGTSESTLREEGFPRSVASGQTGTVRTYLPSVEGLQDTGILSIASFEAIWNDQTIFQDAVQKGLRKIVEAGRCRLIIDLSGNPGGDIVLGADLFAQLFPEISIFAARTQSRFAFRSEFIALHQKTNKYTLMR